MQTPTTSDPIHTRIADSFNAQGLMTTLGAKLALVADGEVHIELPFSTHLSQQLGPVNTNCVHRVFERHWGHGDHTSSV